MAMCTKGSGTNSVNPPVSRCRSRVRIMWRAHERGCSTAPNMMVTLDRRPTWWAVRWAKSHSSVLILSGHRIGPDLVVEDLGCGAGQGLQPGVAQQDEIVGQRHLRTAGAFGDLERGEPVNMDGGRASRTALMTSR